MATLNVLFGFPSDTQSFTATAGANTTMAWSSSLSGSLSSHIAGKNKSNSNKWTRTLTYQDMGVPAGATITGITAGSMQSQCTTFSTGASSTSGNVTLVDGATTVTLSAARTFSATDGSPVTTNGTDSTGLSLPSSDSVTITINNTLATGNSTSAAVTLLQDELAFTLTYSQATTIAAAQIAWVWSGKAAAINAAVAGAAQGWAWHPQNVTMSLGIPATQLALHWAAGTAMLAVAVVLSVAHYTWGGNSVSLASAVVGAARAMAWLGQGVTIVTGGKTTAQVSKIINSVLSICRLMT